MVQNVNFDLVELKESKIRGAGTGVFAATFIPAGTLIGPYRGRYMNAKTRATVKDGRYIWKISENRFVDAIDFPRDNPLRYVNGAKTPTQVKKINCEVRFIGEPGKEKVYYLITKNIPSGEELIISYGKIYFKFEQKKRA